MRHSNYHRGWWSDYYVMTYERCVSVTYMKPMALRRNYIITLCTNNSQNVCSLSFQWKLVSNAWGKNQNSTNISIFFKHHLHHAILNYISFRDHCCCFGFLWFLCAIWSNTEKNNDREWLLFKRKMSTFHLTYKITQFDGCNNDHLAPIEKIIFGPEL